MGAKNIVRLLGYALRKGEKFDLLSGDALKLIPEADDTGAVNVGDGTNDMDVKVFLGATTAYLEADVGNGRLNVEGAEIRFGDTDKLEFGDAGDATVNWDGTNLEILPVTDDTGALNIGDGTTDMDMKWFGGTTNQFVLFDVGNRRVQLSGPVHPQGFNSLSDRFELKWVAGQRGKPGVNADILSATEATRMVTDPDFEVAAESVNGSSDDVTFNAEGGILLQTDGADGDEVRLQPHTDANQTAWEQVTWGTDKETHWECYIQTGSNITNTIIWAGLKLTSTEVKATDNDQVYFRYEDDVVSGDWEVVSSVGGADTSTDTGIAVAVDTKYHLKIVIGSDRIAKCYINGTLAHTTASALTDATDLKPYIGVAADGAAAAKDLIIYGQSISRNMG